MPGGSQMKPKRARGARGLTLLEILLALIVMVLGIVGILALFPPALESAKESMEYTQAAIVGESVANALSVGLRMATVEPASGVWTVTLSHDLETGGKAIRYNFTLPKLTDGLAGAGDGTKWVMHPGMVQSSSTPEEQNAFVLAGDFTTAEQLAEVRKTDPNDPLDQFAFSFRVRKVHTQPWLMGKLKPDGKPYTIEDLDHVTKLYEFQIFIFRLQGGPVQGGNRQPKRSVAVMTTRISTR